MISNSPVNPGSATLFTLAVSMLAGAWHPALVVGDPPKPPAVSKVADEPYPEGFRKRVKASIERALRGLRAGPTLDSPKHRADPLMESAGYEEAAAVLWALRRAGVPASDAAFEKPSERLAARAPKSIDEASLVLLASAAQPLHGCDPFVDEATSGGVAAPRALSDDERATMTRLAQFILDRQVVATGEERGGWGKDRESSNLQQTYLALLGLEAAQRSGTTIPAKAYLDALDYLIREQSPRGQAAALAMNEVHGPDRFEWNESAQMRGFGFAGSMSERDATGYATAGGTIGLAICQDALQHEVEFSSELRERTRVGTRDALTWIQKYFNADYEPHMKPGEKATTYHMEWLLALSRLAIHARMRLVGSHDWYREGAELLIKAQADTEKWGSSWAQDRDCLLFLLRASIVSSVPVVTESDVTK
jgi:hypothetical protein